MQVLPFQIPKPTNDGLIYQEDHEYSFYDQLHEHKEIQLSYILEGAGTLIVGDSISQYKKGDFLAIDGHLPHLFKSDKNQNIKSHMLTLFFTKDSFGTSFFDLEEVSQTQQFFKSIGNGFRVLSNKQSLEGYFLSLKKQTKLERFITFLQIMKLLATAKKQPLSSYIYEKNYSDKEGKRMQLVLSYTMNHFTRNISLTEISDIANMTKNAFCKYFKKRTNKTYIQFLNELRIESASKLLLNQKELSVSEIAYRSGFGNVSNFNRQFKALKNKTPSFYRKHL